MRKQFLYRYPCHQMKTKKSNISHKYLIVNWQLFCWKHFSPAPAVFPPDGYKTSYFFDFPAKLALSKIFISKLRCKRRMIFSPIFKYTISPFTAKISSLSFHFRSRLWCLEIIAWFARLREALWLYWNEIEISTLNTCTKLCLAMVLIQ